MRVFEPPPEREVAARIAVPERPPPAPPPALAPDESPVEAGAELSALAPPPPAEAVELPDEDPEEDERDAPPPPKDGKETLAKLDPPPSRPRPERPPRNCGAISETNFSAVVTPVRRMVFSILPPATVCVRTEDAQRLASACCESCFCQSHQPRPATTAKPMIIMYLADLPPEPAGSLTGRSGAAAGGGSVVGCAGTEGSGCIGFHLLLKPFRHVDLATAGATILYLKELPQ